MPVKRNVKFRAEQLFGLWRLRADWRQVPYTAGDSGRYWSDIEDLNSSSAKQSRKQRQQSTQTKQPRQLSSADTRRSLARVRAGDAGDSNDDLQHRVPPAPRRPPPEELSPQNLRRCFSGSLVFFLLRSFLKFELRGGGG